MKTPTLLLIAFAFVASGCAIGPYTRYVASRVEGRLLDAGRPLANVRVTREIVVQHSGEKSLQTTSTDAAGRFTFEEVTTLGLVESIATWVYNFEIRAELGRETVTVWKGWKTDNHRFGDYRSAHGFFSKQGETLTFTWDRRDTARVP